MYVYFPLLFLLEHEGYVCARKENNMEVTDLYEEGDWCWKHCNQMYRGYSILMITTGGEIVRNLL